MGLRAYTVKKKIGKMVFDCYHPQEWFDRLFRLDKLANGFWMEFTEEELDEMEEDEEYPLTEEEKIIVADIRKALAKTGEDCLYLECG